MASICQAVKAAHADLGVIFDTDVDRGAAVDHRGQRSTATGWWALAPPLPRGPSRRHRGHGLHHLRRAEGVH